MKSKNGLRILFLIGLFLLALIIFFPLNNLKGTIFDKVYKETGVLLNSDSIYLSLIGLPGIGMRNVKIALPSGDGELDLFSDRVTVRPSLSGLFPPVPGVSLKISELRKGGDIKVKLGKGGSSVYFYLDAEEINLEQVTARNSNPPLAGILSIDSDITLNEKDLPKSTGYLKLDVSNMMLNQQNISPPDPSMAAFSFIIPAMKIGKLHGDLNMKNGVLEISQFKFGEDPAADFKGTINGDFKIESSFEQSLLNIAMRLKLSQKILNNPEAKTFVSFLNSYQTSPGEYGLKWSATIQDFTNFTVKAIPERLNL